MAEQVRKAEFVHIPKTSGTIPDRQLTTTPIGQKTRVEDLDETFIKLFREAHSQDYGLYEQAKAMDISHTNGSGN